MTDNLATDECWLLTLAKDSGVEVLGAYGSKKTAEQIGNILREWLDENCFITGPVPLSLGFVASAASDQSPECCLLKKFER